MRSFVCVRIDEKRDRTSAVPLSRNERLFSTLSESDGFLEVPEEREGYSAGETVEVLEWM